eukprot:UN00828
MITELNNQQKYWFTPWFLRYIILDLHSYVFCCFGFSFNNRTSFCCDIKVRC